MQSKFPWKFLAVLTVALVSPSALGADVDALKAQAKKPPKEPEAALALGQSLRQAGQFADAVKVFRAGYAKAKGDAAVALRYGSARALIEAGKQKDAVRECATIKAYSAPKMETCTAEAQLLWKRASLAMPAIERALAAVPGDYDALVAKGRTLRLMGQSSESENTLRSAMKAEPGRYEAGLYLGELFTVLGKNTDAADALRKSHAAAPDEPVPLLMLGEVLPAGTEALGVLKQAIAIRPKYGAALARLGLVELELGSIAEAEQSLKSAIAIDAKQADWHAGLAHVLVAKVAYDEALKEAAAALKLVNNHADAKLAEADALGGKGEIDLAIEAYEKASSFGRSTPVALVHAARACLKGSRPTTARAFADRATQSFADDATSWEVLGDVATATKDKAAAKAAYKKALSASQGKIDKASVKKKLAALK